VFCFFIIHILCYNIHMNELENQNSMADEELKEIAEKLEKELGHQYFDQPLNLAKEKAPEKMPELLELEHEIEKLGEIILPGADLKPKDELPSGEKTELVTEKKPTKNKYQSFRLFKTMAATEKQTRDEEKKLQKEKQAQEKMIREQEKEKEIAEKIARQMQKEKNLAEWKKIKEEREQTKIAEKNKKRQELLLKKERRKKERGLRPKFGWYVMVIKRPIIYLCAVEFLTYFGTLFSPVKNFFTNVILSYIIILDLIVFVWLVARIKKHYGESYGTAIKAITLTGLLTGFFRAGFKVIWVNDLWTIFNVIFEPLIWAGYGLIIGLIVGAIIKKQEKILEI